MPARKELLRRYSFSPCAQRIVTEHAPRIAQKYGSDRVETLHILLAITEEKATKHRSTDYESLLRLQGSSRDHLRKAAKAELERWVAKVKKSEISYSPAAYELLQKAFQATDASNVIHTVHLFAGILHLENPDDPAYKVLHGQGIRAVKTRVLIGAS